jgi:RNA polymerase sigma-70 factor (ECF subfamily)
MPPADQAQWFGEEVKPHEPALRAYLQARFPSLSDHDDLVQETYVRLLKAKAAGNVRYARALLFTTARNAALDLFRRKKVVSMEAITDFTESTVLEEAPDVSQSLARQEELDLLAEAVRSLSDRCRQVVLLRYVDGLSYKEIAAQLGTSPETVKTQLAMSMRRCARFFAARGMLGKHASSSAQESSA